MSTKFIKAQAALEAAKKRHQEELKALEKEAEDARKAELVTVIAQVKAIIKQYGLTPSDIGFKAPKKETGERKSLKGSKVPPKVTHPTDGRTWSGRGSKPEWVKDLEAKADAVSRDQVKLFASE
jgi:DNA-binding protein H-NS